MTHFLPKVEKMCMFVFKVEILVNFFTGYYEDGLYCDELKSVGEVPSQYVEFFGFFHLLMLIGCSLAICQYAVSIRV